MNKYKLLLFISLGGYYTSMAFTQLLYWKYGYPNPVWRELNPILHQAFLDGRPWLHYLLSTAVTILLVALYIGSKSGNLLARTLAHTGLYALSSGFTVNAINDVLAYLLLVSLPFHLAVSAVIAGGLIGGATLIKTWRGRGWSRAPCPCS